MSNNLIVDSNRRSNNVFVNQHLVNSNIPVEVLNIVMQFLDYMGDLYSACRVCIKWNWAVTYSQRQQYILIQKCMGIYAEKLDQEEYPTQIKTLRALQKCDKVFEFTSVLHLSRCITQLKLDGLSTLKNVDDIKLENASDIIINSHLFSNSLLFSVFNLCLSQAVCEIFGPPKENLIEAKSNLLMSKNLLDYVKLYKNLDEQCQGFLEVIFQVFALIDCGKIKSAITATKEGAKQNDLMKFLFSYIVGIVAYNQGIDEAVEVILTLSSDKRVDVLQEAALLLSLVSCDLALELVNKIEERSFKIKILNLMAKSLEKPEDLDKVQGIIRELEKDKRREEESRIRTRVAREMRKLEESLADERPDCTLF